MGISLFHAEMYLFYNTVIKCLRKTAQERGVSVCLMVLELSFYCQVERCFHQDVFKERNKWEGEKVSLGDTIQTVLLITYELINKLSCSWRKHLYDPVTPPYNSWETTCEGKGHPCQHEQDPPSRPNHLPNLYKSHSIDWISIRPVDVDKNHSIHRINYTCRTSIVW